MDVFPIRRTNFRKYGQIKKQRRAVTEKGREEERRSEKKEDAGARKSRKGVKHCVFQWFVAPRVENRLAKAAGAEPSGEMRDGKLHGAVAQSTFLDVEMFKKYTPFVVPSTCPSQNGKNKKHHMSGPLLDVHDTTTTTTATSTTTTTTTLQLQVQLQLQLH